MRQKSPYRVIIAVTLVVAITATLVFSSPLPIRAFDTSISVADSPSSNTTATTSLLGAAAVIPADTYLLGEQVSLPTYIEFDASETKNVQSVQLTLTGPEFSASPFVQDLPLNAGSYSYPANATQDPTKPGVLDVTVTWDAGISQAGGYTFGYGYGGFGDTAKINYDIKWTAPYALTTQPTPPPTALPGNDMVFNITIPPELQNQAWPSLDFPQGLADNGTELFILLPANYWNGNNNKDIIIRTDTEGNYIGFIVAPGNNWETEGLTFIGSTLYAAYNSWDPNTFTIQGVIKKYTSGSWTTIAGLSNLSPIGGLASDGTYLFVAYRDQLRIDKRDPTTGAQIASFDLSQAWGGGGGPGPGPGPTGPPIWGFNALAYSSELYAAQGDTIIIVDASTGDKTDEYKTGMWETRGLTFATENWGGTDYSILYMAITSWPSGMIHRASKPGAVPTVETNPTGNYTAEFEVIADSQTYTSNSTFALDKLTTAPEVTISAPSSGFAKGAGSENITVSGSINDPSISSVTVGIALPSITAFEDDVENETETLANWEHSTISGMMPWGPPYSSQDLWHRSDQRDHTGGSSWSWRYGVEGTNHFNTPMKANAGVLQTADNITIGADNTFTFWTWYDTEMDFWMDRKLVEISTDGTNWQPLAWLAQFWPPFPPPDISQERWDTLTMVPPQSWTKVELSLADYAGQDIFIRFRFDSMDDWGNEGQGWFIDDISISGAGFQGTTVAVADNLTFSTQFTLAEGSNTISVTARRTNYAPLLTGQASVTGSLDTVAPMVVINPVTTPTNQNTQVLTGNVTEQNFDRLTVKVNGVEQYSTTVLSGNTTGFGTFINTVTLSSGTNNILVTVTDDVGLSANATASIIYDAVGPVFEDVFTSLYDVAYKTGEVSARSGDSFFIALKVTDNATGVASVKLVVPNSPQSNWPNGIKVSQIPEAVIDSWGIKASTKAAMNYVIPMQLPSGTPSGNYTWTVRAWDTAGNMAELTPVATSVVTTLEAFNIYLMPNWNLVSSPLIPTTANITTLTADIQASGLFERVWYHDASKAGTADEWVLYQPGISSDLTTIGAGKGYWFKMKDLAAFTAAGKVSGPMATGLPNTPAPVKLTIAGQVLQPGAVVPPTYSVYQGWNLIGLHSEHVRPVSTALSSVTVPQQIWGSLLQYLNYISFPMGPGQEGTMPEIDLGRFDRLVSTDTMQPGRGFWLYMMQNGVIVP